MTLAILAAALAVGGWLGIRYGRTSDRVSADVSTYLRSIPADEWKS